MPFLCVPKFSRVSISQNGLKNYAVVFDAIYIPRVTRLLREATESGATVVSGIEMFVRQAIGQFKFFTGLPRKIDDPAQISN